MFKTLSVIKTLNILLAIFLYSFNTSAQSSLFNIPTTDVMPDGEIYVEADFDSHLTGFESGGYRSYGITSVYGVRKRLEIGINAFYTKAGDNSQSVELQPNAKVQIYNDEKTETAVSSGVILYIPMSRRAARDTIGSVYLTASKQIRGSYGPRFTAGGYALIGKKELTESRNGLLLGYEQPLTKNLYFIADWNSGKNRFGYSAAGLGITLSKRSSLYTAYYFGNRGRGNNSLGIYYGYSF